MLPETSDLIEKLKNLALTVVFADDPAVEEADALLQATLQKAIDAEISLLEASLCEEEDEKAVLQSE